MAAISWRKRRKKDGKFTRDFVNTLRYKGHYMNDGNGEKVFVLTAVRKNGSVHNATYESRTAAIDAGWVKV